MNSFSTFLYQSGISIAVFYLFYRALLRRETWFSLNRILLGASLLLAMLIPFVRITLHSAPAPGTVYYALDRYLLNGVVVHPDHLVENTGLHITAGKALLSVYLLGVLFFTVKFLTQILQVLHLIKKHGIREFEGYRIVPITEEISPFSFFTLIFINTENLGKQELRSILLHEWEHVRRLHTLDILVLEIVCIIQWFNPFVWLYKYSLHELHEYEADQAVIRQGENRLNYQKLILNQAFGHQFFQVAHNLINRSFIKNRILMITKRKSGSITLLKSLFILPVAALLVASFSFTREPENIQQVKQMLSGNKKSSTLLQTPREKKVYTLKEVDKQPKFQGKPIPYIVLWVKDQIRDTIPFTDKPLRISFNVAPTGKITDIDITPDHTQIDPKYLQELRKIFQSAPKCSPGEKDGKKVAVRFSDALMKFFSSHREPATEEELFFIVEEMPKFQGGDIGTFRQWVAEHLRYPKKAAEKRISGKVYVQFVVEPDGSVDRVKVVRSANYQSNRKVMSSNDSLLDREAVRVIKSSPEWTPGKQRGKNVAVAYTIPITFLPGVNMSSPQTTTTPASIGGEVFFIVEQMPKFQGGDISRFREWVAQQLRYPDIAAEAGATGRVFVSFIVETDGSVSHIQIAKSPYTFLRDHPDKSAGINLRAFAALDAEAVRVVRSSPKWEPGVQRGHRVRVKMTIPIVFVLDHTIPARDSLKISASGQPLYIIDGKIANANELDNLDHDKVARVMVQKDVNGDLVKKYGPAAKNGVIFINTKKQVTGPVPQKPKDPFDKSAGYHYLINGKPASWKEAVKYKDRKDLQLISIAKISDKDAIKLFGETAPNGMVVIKAKEK